MCWWRRKKTTIVDKAQLLFAARPTSSSRLLISNCVCFNLDCTLLFTTTTELAGELKYSLKYEDRFVYKRPHFDKLMEHIKRLKIKVVVYTSNTENYTNTIVTQLFEPLHVYPLLSLWDSSTIKYVHTQGGIHTTTTIKPLHIVARNLGIDPDCVVLIDSDKSGMLMAPKNSILIHPFTGDASDGALVKVMELIEYLATTSRVSDTISWNRDLVRQISFSKI